LRGERIEGNHAWAFPKIINNQIVEHAVHKRTEVAHPLAFLYDQATRRRNASTTGIEGSSLGIRKVADTVQTTCKRIEVIMKGLRSINVDRENTDLERSSVKTLADLAFDTVRLRQGSEMPRLEFDTSYETMIVECNRFQIVQVLVNLLNNGSEATGDLPDRWVRLDISSQNGFVEFGVTDSGPGIDPAIRGRIMQPFVSTKAGGRGLGLSIAKKILERHQSKLSIDKNSKNTRFRFALKQLNNDME
jgi:two-component system sensor kinase FixL